MQRSVHWLVLALSFAVTVRIAIACIAASWSLLRGSSIECVRVKLGHGIVDALSLFSATALLTTIGLPDFRSIGLFCAIFALRTFVKYALEHADVAIFRSARC